MINVQAALNQIEHDKIAVKLIFEDLRQMEKMCGAYGLAEMADEEPDKSVIAAEIANINKSIYGRFQRCCDNRYALKKCLAEEMK